MLETNKEIDKHEKELLDDSICSLTNENVIFRTPAMANRRFINKLYSDKKNSTLKKSKKKNKEKNKIKNIKFKILIKKLCNFTLTLIVCSQSL